MSRTCNGFALFRKLTQWFDGDSSAPAYRQTVQPRLEALEDRVVLSASAFAGQPPNPAQLYQQILQAEANPSPTLAPALQNSLNAAVVVLPAMSSFLNAASSSLNTAFGPNVGQQYLNLGIQVLDSVLLNLEVATLSSLNAAGALPSPNFTADAAFINTFMNDPLNFAPPV